MNTLLGKAAQIAVITLAVTYVYNTLGMTAAIIDAVIILVVALLEVSCRDC